MTIGEEQIIKNISSLNVSDTGSPLIAQNAAESILKLLYEHFAVEQLVTNDDLRRLGEELLTYMKVIKKAERLTYLQAAKRTYLTMRAQYETDFNWIQTGNRQ